LGRWYEIARYPNDFEQGCVGVTADYSTRRDGQIRVVNTCRDSSGRTTDRIEGVARVDDRSTNAKLKVSFFWPFSGPYWIIDLDEDYEYAVVGEPGRRFFWILSRSPTIDDGTLDDILNKMPDWQYDPDRLYFVPQFAE
jgi:apolipoprotein D and lipocalin family protein